VTGPAYEPLESLPPARKKFVALLLGYGVERAEVEELLADHLSDLAEALRDAVDELAVELSAFPEEFRKGMHFAANILDPNDGRGVPPERGGRG
jgi:predicted Zn-dependent protease with MMP-like domain